MYACIKFYSRLFFNVYPLYWFLGVSSLKWTPFFKLFFLYPLSSKYYIEELFQDYRYMFMVILHNYCQFFLCPLIICIIKYIEVKIVCLQISANILINKDVHSLNEFDLWECALMAPAGTSESVSWSESRSRVLSPGRRSPSEAAWRSGGSENWISLVLKHHTWTVDPISHCG